MNVAAWGVDQIRGSPVAVAQARRSTQFGFFANSMELEFRARVYMLPP
jgi:hypothetical protein